MGITNHLSLVTMLLANGGNNQDVSVLNDLTLQSKVKLSLIEVDEDDSYEVTMSAGEVHKFTVVVRTHPSGKSYGEAVDFPSYILARENYLLRDRESFTLTVRAVGTVLYWRYRAHDGKVTVLSSPLPHVNQPMTFSTYADARAYYTTLDSRQFKLTLSTEGATLTWRLDYYSGTYQVFTSPIKD